MPKHELIKSLEREGFQLDYPDNYSNEEKITQILKTEEKRLYLAIPLLLEKKFNYEKIRKNILRLNRGEDLLKEFNKIILISKEIFRKTKRDFNKLDELVKKNKIKSKLKESEFEYYLEAFKEAKENSRIMDFDNGALDLRKSMETFNAAEKIFSPAKIRILKKIYDSKELTPSEKTYYYRDIKPMIDAILNVNLKEYLELVLSGRRRK